MNVCRFIAIGSLAIVTVTFASVAKGVEPSRFEPSRFEPSRFEPRRFNPGLVRNYDLANAASSFLRPALNGPVSDYASFYRNHLQTFRRPPIDIDDYIFDKYFFHNPNISPYLNLTRRNVYGNNYYQRVLPERTRREIANAPRPKPVFTEPTMVAASVGPIHTALPIPADTGIGVSVPKTYRNLKDDSMQADPSGLLGSSLSGMVHR